MEASLAFLVEHFSDACARKQMYLFVQNKLIARFPTSIEFHALLADFKNVSGTMSWTKLKLMISVDILSQL